MIICWFLFLYIFIAEAPTCSHVFWLKSTVPHWINLAKRIIFCNCLDGECFTWDKLLLSFVNFIRLCQVGPQNLAGNITDGNACCIKMLLVFQEAIKDYSTPPEKALIWDLPAKISYYVSFLIKCMPLSIRMGNAMKFLKSQIAKLPHILSE